MADAISIVLVIIDAAGAAYGLLLLARRPR
jgi:hypothetical protein